MMVHPDRALAFQGLTIASLLDRWPAATAVFIRHHMACIGCDFSGFHTPADAARVYQLHPSSFFQDLDQIMTEFDQA